MESLTIRNLIFSVKILGDEMNFVSIISGLIPIAINKLVDVPAEANEYIMDRVMVWLKS